MQSLFFPCMKERDKRKKAKRKKEIKEALLAGWKLLHKFFPWALNRLLFFPDALFKVDAYF